MYFRIMIKRIINLKMLNYYSFTYPKKVPNIPSNCLQRKIFYFKPKSNEGTNFRCQGKFILAGLLTWLGFKKEEKEDPMIVVMKLGILNLQKEQYDKAETLLHIALKLAQERKDMDAQRYIFDILANVAFQKGDLPKAEKLFIQVTKELIASGTPIDDNAIIEISLKLASIYSQLNQRVKAEKGFKFCIDAQQNKLNNINLQDTKSLSNLEKDTLLLWAMSLDWYAKYQLSLGLFHEAKTNLQKALDISERINGENHPQTLILLNDIGSIDSLLKEYNSAIKYFLEAIKRSTGSDSSEISSFYCNLGATYSEMGNFKQGEQACKKALSLAKKFNNVLAQEDAEKCLSELRHKR